MSHRQAYVVRHEEEEGGYEEMVVIRYKVIKGEKRQERDGGQLKRKWRDAKWGGGG